MFAIKPQTLQYWYKNFLSDYFPDIKNDKWHPQQIEMSDKSTGEIKEKPVYIFKQENIGEKKSIDDKCIVHEGFTVLSNHQTGKIAMLIESTKSKEVENAMELFGNKLKTIKYISMDMSPTYALVCNNLMPGAARIIDKFHVMKYVYEAITEVRIRIKKEVTCTLTKGKQKTEEDKKMLSELELLRRVQHAITQSPDKWNEEMQQNVNKVFEKYNDLKTAYQIGQNFKHWYDYQNHIKSMAEIKKNLYQWYEQARQVKEFESVIKMIRKHEREILNFFGNGMTNAKAERLNGKMQRFISNNYGIKDKDFILYRIANYF
jgi:transposase